MGLQAYLVTDMQPFKCNGLVVWVVVGWLGFFFGFSLPLSWTILLIKIPSECCCVLVGLFCLLGWKTESVALRKDLEYRKCLYREEKELLQEESWKEGGIERLLCACTFSAWVPKVDVGLWGFFREDLECTFFLSCRLSHFLGRVAITIFYTCFECCKSRILSGWREVPTECGKPCSLHSLKVLSWKA